MSQFFCLFSQEIQTGREETTRCFGTNSLLRRYCAVRIFTRDQHQFQTLRIIS